MIATATLTSVYGLVENMKQDLTRQVGELGPSIVVTPSTQGLTFSYGGISLPEILYAEEILVMDDVKEVESVLGESARVISPRLVGLLKGSEDVLVEVVGSWWEKEQRMRPWLETIEGAEILLANEVVIGSQLADTLQVSIGEEMVLEKQAFIVKDILMENGTNEDRQVFMNLEKAQELLVREGEVDRIEIATSYQVDDDQIVEALSETLPKALVVSMRKEALRVDSMYIRFVRFGGFLTILVVGVSLFVVALTMSLSVKERTREIGILRAIGFRKKQIAKMILLEAFILSFLGGMIGYIIGLAFSGYTGIESLGLSMVTAIGMGIVSSLYPANQAASQDPSIALRYI
jgi:putative ABC transport system permease protein